MAPWPKSVWGKFQIGQITELSLKQTHVENFIRLPQQEQTLKPIGPIHSLGANKKIVVNPAP